jgi:quercetin dioxygenase-like cupin family protein
MTRLFILTSVLCFASVALAQDPVKVDPKHYKVEFENAHVRVVHVTYGAHEKSVMHHHPDAVAVFLADQTATFTLPNGKTIERTGKAGQAIWTPAETHLPENTSDKPLEVVLIELKGPPRAHRAMK